jgi:signal transduction histidine kinase
MLGDVRGSIEPGPCRRYVTDILRGSQHLMALVTSLFDIADAESGRLELSEEAFDLVGLGKEIVDMLAGEALVSGVNFSIVTGSASLWLNGDRQLIRQLLLALVSNALKFTPRGGKVRVDIARNALGETEVLVEDNGIGMPSKEIPRAFADFVQPESDYTRIKEKGTGLGLALCKRRVEMHQGRIELDSQPGVGTVVLVSFPPERASAEIISLPIRKSPRRKAADRAPD